MRQQTTDKRSVCYRQFQGGYANFPAIELRALMEGNRRPFFRRSEVRVFRLDGRRLLCTKIAACKLKRSSRWSNAASKPSSEIALPGANTTSSV